MARAFDGTNDEIRVAIGNCNITTAITMGAIWRRVGTGYTAVIGLHTSGGTATYTIEYSEDPNDFLDFAGTTFSSGEAAVDAADSWVLSIVTKAAGTVAPRSHLYKYGTNAWDHRDFAATVANQSSVAGGTVRFGEWQDADDLEGDIAVAGVWSRALTDAECELLPYSLVAWYASAPSGLWVLDQSATTQTVVDLTGGGANESGTGGTLVGTTVSTVSVPVWNYGDGAQSVQVIRAAGGAPQDTPELYGSPSLRAERQFTQLIAT